MPNEYYALILEFTLKSVNLGFAGEQEAHVSVRPMSPVWKRFVFPSDASTRYPSVLGLGSHSLLDSDKKRIVASLSDNEKHALTQFNREFGHSWFCWGSDKYRTLARIVKYLVLSLLLVSNASAKIFVVDGGLAAAEKFQLCEAFFARKVAVATSFLPRALCAMVAAGVDNGLLVDLRWDACVLVSVFDLRSISTRRLEQFGEENLCYKSEEQKASNLTQAEIASLLLDEAFFSAGLPKEIASEILSLGIDCRSLVAGNIVFSGPLSNNSKLTGKIILAVKEAAGHITVMQKAGLGAWAGASLYCSVALLKEEKSSWRIKEITKDILKDSWGDLQVLNS